MPRALVWLLIAGAAVAGYFFVIEPAIDRAAKATSLAETREARLSQYARAGDRLRSAGEAVALGVRKHGEIAMPGDPQTRPLEFNQAIDAILREQGISEVTSTSRSVPMTSGPLSRHLGSEAKVERVVKKLSFAATPEALTSTLAAIENHPLVATVSELRVRQSDGDDKADRKLRIDMDVETWVVTKKGRAGG